MMTEIARILDRARDSLLEDGIGVLALFALLFVGLHLSGTA